VSLKKNVIANYIGQGWTSLMGIAFVPVYISYLGMESYGLIGVFALLQAWLTLLDMGMTPTLNREMARFQAGAHSVESIRDLLRSLEGICLAMALLIWGGVSLSSGWLAAHWLKVEKLPLDTVAGAIAIMALMASLKFVENFYRSALMGLQRQVWLNTAGSLLATLRWAGAVGVLAWVAPSIRAFFLWQAFVSILNVLAFIVAMYRSLPPASRPARFSPDQLQAISRFAGGMMVQSLLVLLLMQVDKIILSRLLTLQMFGYYTLAGTVAAALYQLTTPVTQAYYPRFSELVVRDDQEELKRVYHHGAQLVSVMLGPAALVLVFFGGRILQLWTGNAVVAQQAGPLLALLALGTMLNGLIHIPYMLALAHGWSGFAVRVNSVAVAVLVPAIIWATPRYGAIGAASIWVLLNCGYLLLATRFLYSRLMSSERRAWFLQDLLSPLVAASAAVLLLWWLSPVFSSRLLETAWLAVVSGCTLAAGAFAAPTIRRGVLMTVQRRSGTCSAVT